MTSDVSIVIPVFNRSHDLGRAIRSCGAQHCAVEVIVVDDGSSEDILAALERSFPDGLDQDDANPVIRYIRQDNQGACVARNEGLTRAAGTFVKFLDSDDELIAGSLVREVHAAKTHACDVVLTAWEERTYKEDGSEDTSKRRSRPAPMLDRGIDDMLDGKGPWTSAALYRHAFIKSLRWDPAWTKAQDWGWCLTVCLAGARFHTLDMPSSIYNHHSGERVSGKDDVILRSTLARQYMLNMIERRLRAQQMLTEERRRKLSQYFYRDAQVLAARMPEAWKQCWEHCRSLTPGFQPTERSLAVRTLSRLFGIHAGLRIYVTLKRLLPRAMVK